MTRLVASRLDPIIQEGQHLERLLQENLGQPLRTPIIFSETGTVIVDAGEDDHQPAPRQGAAHRQRSPG